MSRDPEGSISRGLSRIERRLFFAYEDELRERLRYGGRAARVLSYQLRALAVFLAWLHARRVELHHACPEDLLAYRRTLRGDDRARRFEAVRRLYRSLYGLGLIGHDPGAVADLPPRRHRRR